MATNSEKVFYNFIQERVKKSYTYIGTKVYNLTPDDVGKIKSLGDKWGIPMEWLCNLMNHESAGTFNPAIQNSIGATGLIQFLKSTAKGLGTSTDNLKTLTFQQQLEYVDKYLDGWKGTWNKRGLITNGKINDNFQQPDLFMTIFYPGAIGKPNFVFPAKVQSANGGIKTPMDYARKALTNPPFPLSEIPSTLPEYRTKIGNIKGSVIITPGITPVDEDKPLPEEPKTPAKEISIINSTEAQTEFEQVIKFLSLDGEFLFNVQKDEFFEGNESVGGLYIIGKGEIYSKVEDSQLDGEYVENAFAGKEEVDPEFDPVEALIIKSLPKVNSEDSPENPNEIQPVGEDVKTNGGDLKTIKATGKWDGAKVKRLISGSSWETKAANYIAKVEAGSVATLKAAWDVDHYRMGFGNQKIIKDGKIYEVTGTGPMSTCTAKEAITTLVDEGVPKYAEVIAKAIGKKYWDKLTGNQKAALTSLGYNCGAGYIGGRPYGKRIKQAIIDGEMEKAANEILNGPQKADGKVLSGLVKRRKEEASLFLLPDTASIYGDGTV